MRGQNRNAWSKAEEEMASDDDALRTTPVVSESCDMRGTAGESLQQHASVHKDQELKLFREIPHSSEYAPGIDPDCLKEKLYHLDDNLYHERA